MATRLPAPPSVANVAYLELSEAHPTAGATITVTGRIGSDSVAGHRPGSFAAHVLYDSARLTFVDASSLPGAMSAVNGSVPGTVAVAGAAGDGFDDGRLFVLRFRVADPAGVGSMSLTLTELTDVDFHDRLPAVSVAAGLHTAADAQPVW